MQRCRAAHLNRLNSSCASFAAARHLRASLLSAIHPERAPVRRLVPQGLFSPHPSGAGEGQQDDLRSILAFNLASPVEQPVPQTRRRQGPRGGALGAEALANRSASERMESVPLLSKFGQSYSVQKRGQDDPNAPPGFNWQYLVFLCTLGIVICYADRSNISTAVLPMAEQFGWDKAYTGVVLSVFFSGYATTQILGGKLADQFGGKMVLAAGVALWSLFTFLTPAAAAAGTLPLLAARVMLGVGEGVAFPAIHSLIARNVPVANQSTAVGIVTAASYAGTALAFGVSPLIISNFGWEWVFYSFAAMALLWLPLWLPVRTLDKFKSSPDPSRSGGPDADASSSAISIAVGDDGKASSSGGGGSGGASLWALLQRREVWAICAAQYGQSWGMYGLLNWLPTFFADFYKVELADLGSYTLLPYVFQGGLGAATGFLADYLIRSGWSVGTVRRVLQVVGMLGPAACLLLAVSPAVGASAGLASSLITAGLGFSALTLGGVSASHLDIAPRNAGLVFGAGNTAATLAGLISVPVTGYVLQATGSWPLVFGITAFHYVAGALLWAWWCGDRPLPEDGGSGNGGEGGPGSGGSSPASLSRSSSAGALKV